MPAKLFVGTSTDARRDSLRAALEYIGLSQELSRSQKIFVKPNFTFPRPVRGVTTTREMLGEAVGLLAETGAEVFVGESNGGYGSFLASESFAGQGLEELCKQSGAIPVDLSKEESAEYEEQVGGRKVSVRLPRLLVEDVDFTVSMPVLKVHAMTTVSLSIKNLWGCYATDLRLLEHRELDRKLALICKLVKARFGIVDATYGLDNHGPMEGTARFLGKFVAANDLLTLDLACAKMMGFDPRRIRHLTNLMKFTTGELRAPAFESNEDLRKHQMKFTLHRDIIDSLSFACFHSDLLAKVVFDSPFTLPIYATLGRRPRRKLV